MKVASWHACTKSVMGRESCHPAPVLRHCATGGWPRGFCRSQTRWSGTALPPACKNCGFKGTALPQIMCLRCAGGRNFRLNHSRMPHLIWLARTSSEIMMVIRLGLSLVDLNDSSVAASRGTVLYIIEFWLDLNCIFLSFSTLVWLIAAVEFQRRPSFTLTLIFVDFH